MINTEAKQLTADLRKVRTRQRKLRDSKNRELRSLERLHDQQIKALWRQFDAEKKQLDRAELDITKRLNLVVGRAGK